VLVLRKHLLTNWPTDFIHKVLNRSCRNCCGRVAIFENHDIADVISIVVVKTSIFKNLVCLFVWTRKIWGKYIVLSCGEKSRFEEHCANIV